MIGRDWWLAAACEGTPTRMFFPPGGDNPYGKARAICSGCPVTSECLEAALDEEAGVGRDDRAGMRGGLTPAERHRISVNRKRNAA